jgi:hypothetical protein
MANPPTHNGEEFFVDTHYEKMARRPGGLPRDKALAAARQQIDDLKAGFIGWLDGQLKELAGALSDLDADPSAADRMERAYRLSGEIRDVGTTLGYGVVTFMATTLCDVLDAIKAGAAYEKSMIDCHIDALFYVVKKQGILTEEQTIELTGGLRRVAGIASISPDKAD